MQGVFNLFSRHLQDVLGKLLQRHLQDVFKTSKCLLGGYFNLAINIIYSKCNLFNHHQVLFFPPPDCKVKAKNKDLLIRIFLFFILLAQNHELPYCNVIMIKTVAKKRHAPCFNNWKVFIIVSNRISLKSFNDDKGVVPKEDRSNNSTLLLLKRIKFYPFHEFKFPGL